MICTKCGEERDEWFTDTRECTICRYAREIARLKAEVDTLRKALKAVEWSYFSCDYYEGEGFYCCPICNMAGPGPHAPDCQLAAALATTKREG